MNDEYAIIDDTLCNEIENDDDLYEYDERIHDCMCELIARIDTRFQFEKSNALFTIRNACHAFIETKINKR